MSSNIALVYWGRMLLMMVSSAGCYGGDGDYICTGRISSDVAWRGDGIILAVPIWLCSFKDAISLVLVEEVISNQSLGMISATL